MAVFFSKKTGGFYREDIHGESIPSDAIEITDRQHESLLQGQSDGKVIAVGSDGFPNLHDPLPTVGNDLIKSQIASLETEITDRRLREAVLGTDGGWLKDQDRKISELRSMLK